ncbi:hypothetical protein GM658_16315 [Pseudoduganella eburnea]|uniref:Cell envelope biogenesis protein TolA n=1 Tax=Massilia eburnea TaxID=1776165 RepID=A0A6L6QJ83_9BURK|nr:hypothetical protein [Massilia eburnea]MTW12170.1 hypothetical protein [Massilia eburnea]
MKMHKLMLLALGACIASAAFAQDKQNATQEQPNQPKTAAKIKMRPASSARTATGMKEGKQPDAQDRYEKTEKVAGSMQKKANDTANAAASNVK